MIRAIVRHSMGGPPRWIVEVDRAEDLDSYFPVRTRGLGVLGYADTPTHAEAITLAHELIKKENERA